MKKISILLVLLLGGCYGGVKVKQGKSFGNVPPTQEVNKNYNLPQGSERVQQQENLVVEEYTGQWNFVWWWIPSILLASYATIRTFKNTK